MRKLKKAVLPIISGFVMLVAADVSLAKRQPAMENAIRALDNAERILRKAIPNKGGHRAKALRLIKKAKREVQKGIKFANKRAAGGQYKQRQDRKERVDSKRDQFEDKTRMLRQRQ